MKGGDAASSALPALTLLSLPAGPAARADCLLSDLFHGADTALRRSL